MNINKKILVCDKIEPEGIKLLKNAGFDLIENPTITPDELIRSINDVDVVIVRSRTKITKDVLNSASSLKLIGRPGTGVDNIDLSSAAEKNISVITSVEASTNAVAELTISLAVSLARSIPKADAALKNELWLKNSLLGTELRGKTFGVIGMGRIGRRTARLAVALEMNVLGFEKEIIDDEFLKKYNIKQIDFEDLLKRSDFVSLHLPLTSETTHIMGSKQFDMMKNSAYLINTARGQLINESDLYQALVNNNLAGAALDVFSKEPPHGNKLIQLDNVIATPHIGAQIIEAQKEASIVIAQKIIKFFDEINIMD